MYNFTTHDADFVAAGSSSYSNWADPNAFSVMNFNGSQPSPRYSHATFIDGDQLILVGGITADSNYTSVWVLDLSKLVDAGYKSKKNSHTT